MQDDDETSDEDLARRMLAGDETAARRLLARFERPLFGTLLRLTADREAAEDLFQETFLRTLRAGASYDPSRRFQPWLFAIALNLVRDRARRLAHAATPRLATDAATPEPAIRDHGPTLTHRIDLERALASLPNAQREAVVLRYIEGLEESEIATAARIPRGTVKSRLHHGLRKLREALKTP